MSATAPQQNAQQETAAAAQVKVQQARVKVTKMPAPKGRKVAAAKTSAVHDHPKYIEMIQKALGATKDRKGVSKATILKYIMANFDVGQDSNNVNNHLKMALRRGVGNGDLKQVKGKGASGSFKIGDGGPKAAKPAAAAKNPEAGESPKKKTKAKTTSAAKKSPVAVAKKSPKKKATAATIAKKSPKAAAPAKKNTISGASKKKTTKSPVAVASAASAKAASPSATPTAGKNKATKKPASKGPRKHNAARPQAPMKKAAAGGVAKKKVDVAAGKK